MRKNIWIYNHYAISPDYSGGTRHYDFARELVSRGYQVTIVAASFHYNQYKEIKDYGKNEYFFEEDIDGVHYVWVKTMPYQKNNWKRIINMFSFYSNIQKYTFKKENVPELIIGSSVHLFTVLGAKKIADRLGVPFIMEIRDLWPETLIQMGVSKWHPFVLLLSFTEKYLYKNVKTIVSNLPKAHVYIDKITKGKVPVHWLSNGVAINKYKEAVAVEKKTHFEVLYTGTIGVANNMIVLMKAAKLLKDKYPDIQFKIVGDGVLKPDLEFFVKDNNLHNVRFCATVPKTDVPKLLAQANVLFVAIKDLKLYEYGISLNKLYDYLAARKPVIAAISSSNNPIHEAKAGLEVNPDDYEGVANAILKIKAMSEIECTQLGENGFNYVNDNFSIKVLTDRLEKIVEEAE